MYPTDDDLHRHAKALDAMLKHQTQALDLIFSAFMSREHEQPVPAEDAQLLVVIEEESRKPW